MKAALAIDAQDGIGEAPAWDAARSRLLWCDNVAGVVHEAKADGAGGWQESRRWNLGQPMAAVLPRAQGGLVVATGNELRFVDEAETASRTFVSLGFDLGQFRLGDAKCDPAGRLWVNMFAHDFSPRGRVYRVEPNGTIRTMLDAALLSNGMEWSLDGATFYFADSAKRTVDAFDYDEAGGSLRRRRNFVTIERGGGAPNGLAIDCEGCLWVALTGGGQVRRYAPDGALLTQVEISRPGATSCAFGGNDASHLFITSRSGRLPDIALSVGVKPEMMVCDGPEAGGLFVCRPGVQGAPATPFAG